MNRQASISFSTKTYSRYYQKCRLKWIIICFSISFICLNCSTQLVAQDSPQSLTKFNADSVRIELTYIFQELRSKHPGFYRYTQQEEFDAEIEAVLSAIDSPINELEIYRLIKPLIAKIGCLHTGISLSLETEAVLNRQANCLPFQLYYTENQAFIIENFSKNTSIPLGSRLISINGQDIVSIYQNLLQQIPMDGYNESGKLLLLQYNFALWYRSLIQISTEFSVEIDTDQQIESYQLKGVTADSFPEYKDIVSDSLGMNIQDGTAIIRIPSFAKSYHKRHKQNFKKEIKRYFKRIKKENIQYLIVDLRTNTGGSDSYAVDFTSYFFDAPFRYWDRIEVSEPIAKDIKGLNRLFYSKPRKEGELWIWKKSKIFTNEFDFYELQSPSKHAFKGQAFILIDGLCMSSCADVAAILSYHKKAIFIGEETGGGYDGNTSGIIPEEELSCGISISIPLLKYVNAVGTAQTKGRGSIPTYRIQASPTDIIQHTDPVLDKAYQLIHNQKQAASGK